MTSQNAAAGLALTEALNAGILALNTLQNPDATAPADADQLDAATDAALDVLVRFRDALTLADRHGAPVPDAMVSSLDVDALTVAAWRLDATLETDRLAPVPVVRLADAEALGRTAYAAGAATATPSTSPDVCDECGAAYAADASGVVGPWHLESCSAYAAPNAAAATPVEVPWTVIGFYDDGDPEPLVLAVVPGHVEVAEGDTELDWFADPVAALDAADAVKVALADRAGE